MTKNKRTFSSVYKCNTLSGQCTLICTALNFPNPPLKTCSRCKEQKGPFDFIDHSYQEKRIIIYSDGRLCAECRPPFIMKTNIIGGKNYWRFDLHGDDGKKILAYDESSRAYVNLKELGCRRMEKHPTANPCWDKFRMQPYLKRPRKGLTNRIKRHNVSAI